MFFKTGIFLFAAIFIIQAACETEYTIMINAYNAYMSNPTPENQNAYDVASVNYVQCQKDHGGGCGTKNTHQNDCGSRFIDLDHDGRVDLMVNRYICTSSSQIYAYQNTGNGWQPMSSNFNSPIALTADPVGDLGVRFVDFDHDGYKDMVQYRNLGNNVTIKSAYRNSGSGWVQVDSRFYPPVNITVDWLGDVGTRFVDVDHDGFEDFVFNRYVAPGTSIIGAYRNTTNGWVQLPAAYNPPVSLTADAVGSCGVEFVDVDHDGYKDLIYSRWIGPGNEVKGAYRNTGSGWSALPSQFTPPYNLAIDGQGSISCKFVDVDGDGFEDMVVNRGGANVVRTYRNTGNGWSLMSSNYNSPIVFYFDNVGDLGANVVDVDNDGRKDLVQKRWISSNTQQVSTYKNTGSGWQVMNSTYWVPWFLSIDPL